MIYGVFGGSFNPVHNGHIAVAREAVASGMVDKVLMVLSPQNPLKKSTDLLDDAYRMSMLRLAVAPYPELEACDVELSMPIPSYTIDTLRRLKAIHPADTFRLIIGADNYAIFNQWRSADEIVNEFAPIVYPRQGSQMPPDGSEGFTPLYAPLFAVSSTQIRNLIATGRDVGNLLPPSVVDFIQNHNLYHQA